MPGANWLEMLLQLVPDRGGHLFCYYRWCSNRVRGVRKAETADPEKPIAVLEGVPEQIDTDEPSGPG